jgi:hypothetical protein
VRHELGENGPLSDSLLKRILDTNFGGRDRDRAVERSPAFKLLDELRGLLVVHALHSELKMH